MKRLTIPLALLVLTLPAFADNGHYLIDFSSVVASCPGGWTTIPDTALNNNVTVYTLQDTTGAATSRSLKFTTAATDTAGNPLGTIVSTIYPSCATADSFFVADGGSAGASLTIVFQLQGLDNSKTYTLKFYGSRAGVADNRQAAYTVGSTTVYLDAANNVDGTISISGVAPTSGVIAISMVRGPANTNASHYAYLNVLEVTQDPSASRVQHRVQQ